MAFLVKRLAPNSQLATTVSNFGRALTQGGNLLAPLVAGAHRTATTTPPPSQATRSASTTSHGPTPADFYVNPLGETMPSTAYRYMDSSHLAQTKLNMSAPLSYFTPESYASGSQARSSLQIDPAWGSNARLKARFDTLQLANSQGVWNAKAPLEFGGKGPNLEPITSSYPHLGQGGAQQWVPTHRPSTVQLSHVEEIPET